MHSSLGPAIFLGLFDPEDEYTTVLQNIRNYFLSDTDSHPRRLRTLVVFLKFFK